jgi:hypothetical protein
MGKIGIVARDVGGRGARVAFIVMTQAGQTKPGEARSSYEKQAGYLFQARWKEAELEHLLERLHCLVAGSLSNLSQLAGQLEEGLGSRSKA